MPSRSSSTGRSWSDSPRTLRLVNQIPKLTVKRTGQNFAIRSNSMVQAGLQCDAGNLEMADEFDSHTARRGSSMFPERRSRLVAKKLVFSFDRFSESSSVVLP